MSKWAYEIDDGLISFYKDGIQTNVDKVFDALNAIDAEYTVLLQSDCVQTVAELEAKIAELQAENDRLQDAWFHDETICPDGSLRPKVSTLLENIAELERSNELHRNLNNDVANALGLKLGDSWHNLPEKVTELQTHIAKLEAEIAELKPYRDGYDANEIYPEEGENVIVETKHEMFLAQRRGDTWYYSIGNKSKVISEVRRWWKIPEMRK